jgi:predicted ATPase
MLTYDRRGTGAGGGALSHDASTPYLPIGMLMRALFGVDDLDDHAAMDRKVRKGLEGAVTEVDPLIPVVQSLMVLPVSSADWSGLDPQHRRDRIIEGVKHLVLRSAEIRPMVLVFEDLHWVDAESQRVLDALIEAMGAHRLLPLVTHRPEYRREWMQKSFYSRIRVDPLADTSARAMLGPAGGSGSCRPMPGGREAVTALISGGVRRSESSDNDVDGLDGRQPTTRLCQNSVIM